MGAVVGIVALIVVVVAYSQYIGWLRRGMRQRTIVTTLAPDQLAQIFRATVVVAGWSLIEEGNPMVARSPRWAGMTGALHPQEITMRIEKGDDSRTHVAVWPNRYVRKILGGPTRAHTLRRKLNHFEAEVRARDTQAALLP